MKEVTATRYRNVYPMTLKQFFEPAAALAVVGLIFLGGMVMSSPRAHADNDSENLVEIGLNIAPVHLTYAAKDRNLVGLGSFIVNAQADCNGCHGSDPTMEFKDPGNPFFNQHPTVFNPATYLNGGQNFGAVGPGFGGSRPGTGPDIITRNLTPNGAGVPEGGRSFSEFLTIIRTGADLDHIHPNCTSKITTNCYIKVPGDEVDGDLLQVMPWPKFGNMTDDQLQAIWTYLSAIPCIDNKTSTPPAGAPNELRNNCSH